MLAAFGGGTIIGLLAVISIVRYPVNRTYMNEVKAALAEQEASKTPADEDPSVMNEQGLDSEMREGGV
jgi:hypothetical protein